MPQYRVSAGYTSLYSFGKKHSDGQQPKAALIDVKGTLYGTTYGGGKYGLGTAFLVSTAGTEKLLYSFQGNTDGANPSASLLAMKGCLFGTTEHGGYVSYFMSGHGTVFRITMRGAEKVLHSFGGYSSHSGYDGANPVASLIDVDGTLYGTTSNGGDTPCFGSGCGTVFSVGTSGTEKVLHSFGGYSDGATPLANLIDVNGTLYGTTEVGGSGSNSGYGTVFSISTSSSEKVLHAFLPEPYSSDGAAPSAGLINVGGMLYGTAAYSGVNNLGTAFSVSTSGSLALLYTFGSGSDGGRPLAPLLNVKGSLYGMTSAGGAYRKGTVFSMSLTGADEKVLHSFGNSIDGATPLAGLVNVKGTLYGTTSAGGTYGDGTVFALTP